MADQVTGKWRYRLLFVLLAGLLGFVQLLPINPGVERYPGPDLLLLIALSWTVMRPSSVPVPLIAAVFLVADLLFMRPPGLWTALVVLGCEFLRFRRILIRNAPFFVEWLLVAAVIVTITLVNALVSTVFGVAQASAGIMALHMLYTIMCYPLVVILAGRAFGLKKPSGERESIGSGR